MEDQPMTRAKFAGITTTLTTTISDLTTTLGGEPIRVPRGGNIHIIKDSSSLKVEKIDAFLELLDQVEDVIGVDNDTICDKTAHSCNSQHGLDDELPIKANHLIERNKSHIPKEVVNLFFDSNYLAFDEGGL
ncbi:hypothetical protein MTR_8g467950 [Medicago truncatula]|uniref:Uncharacterized protein n=1 Tax=Medicago truncatula TaxID=3880 RepID=A0A072TRB8_MEDTR|nr:hypothetical protein MTR_8g467950 [Medicago truncatula]